MAGPVTADLKTDATPSEENMPRKKKPLTPGIEIPHEFNKLGIPFPVNNDSGLAVWAFVRNSERVGFPKFGMHNVVFLRGSEMDDPEYLRKEKILSVNCGFSPLDHHPPGNFPGECAFTRMLELLKLRHSKLYSQLAPYTVYDDTHHRSVKQWAPTVEERAVALGALVKVQHPIGVGWHNSSPLVIKQVGYEVLDWIFKTMDNYIKHQRQFHFVTSKLVEEATLHKVGEYAVVVSPPNCDDPKFGSYARYKYGLEATMVIQRWSNGQTQITTHSQCKIFQRADDFAVAIRLAELRYRGYKDPVDHDLLKVEGRCVIPGLPPIPWYYMRPEDLFSMENDMVSWFNGTPRHDALESAIPHEKQVDYTVNWLRNQLIFLN